MRNVMGAALGGAALGGASAGGAAFCLYRFSARSSRDKGAETSSTRFGRGACSTKSNSFSFHTSTAN